MSDALANLAAQLRAIATERGWTTAETLRALRRQLRPGPRDPRRADRDAHAVAVRYRDLVADGICVRCRVEAAGDCVRCPACREEVNRQRREQYRRGHEGAGRAVHRCSACGGTDHTRPRCEARAAAKESAA